jgi:hypothetical protein
LPATLSSFSPTPGPPRRRITTPCPSFALPDAQQRSSPIAASRRRAWRRDRAGRPRAKAPRLRAGALVCLPGPGERWAGGGAGPLGLCPEGAKFPLGWLYNHGYNRQEFPIDKQLAHPLLSLPGEETAKSSQSRRHPQLLARRTGDYATILRPICGRDSDAPSRLSGGESSGIWNRAPAYPLPSSCRRSMGAMTRLWPVLRS